MAGMRAMMTPGQAVIEVLRSQGVDRVFGNPGTTELPFLDALVEAGRPEYLLALHEGPLVAMADGYARVTHRPAVVSLHVAAGLANGLIGLLNARRSRTPIVVLAGQQDRRHLWQEPMLGGDLVALAQGAVRWATEVTRVEDLVPALRQAFARAAGPPAGPVLVSLPMDLFAEPVRVGVTPPLLLDPELTSPAIAAAATVLHSARTPAVVAGDGVGRARAVKPLITVAEALGAAVYHQPMHDGIDFPLTHPQLLGMLPPDNAADRAQLAGHDVILLAGARFWPHHYSEGLPIPDGATVVQVDDEPAELGRPVVPAVAVGGGLRANLAALAEALGPPGPDARSRAAELAARSVRQRTEIGDAGLAADPHSPMDPVAAAHAVAVNLPESATLVEEAITTGLLVRRALRIDRPGHFLHTIGGGLGWGIGAAIGARLGRPDSPVVAVIGDGCAAFGMQGLWTAARYSVPVLFVVADNREYRTLKQTITRQGGPAARAQVFPGMDLDQPAIDWPALARSLGVTARRVEHAAELADAVRTVADLTAPLLLDVPLRPYPKPQSPP
jgi:benzoylformate decarboxylase